MVITNEIIESFGLFRCQRLGARITKKSCILQYRITEAETIEAIAELGVSTKWTNMDKRLRAKDATLEPPMRPDTQHPNGSAKRVAVTSPRQAVPPATSPKYPLSNAE